jgi:hypothetical protein
MVTEQSDSLVRIRAAWRGLRFGVEAPGNWLSLGPIRNRRIAWGVWFAIILARPVIYDGLFDAWHLAQVTAALLCALRAARMRVEHSDGEFVVVNFFRTIRVPVESVTSAGFAPAKWDGFAVPLVLAGDGYALRASGVSVWSRQWRWPDQAFVRGKRSLARIERFFEGCPVVFDARDPVPTKAAALRQD